MFKPINMMRQVAKVYYSTSIRSLSSSNETLPIFGMVEQIATLEKIVDVTTKHMANSGTIRSESGERDSDEKIYDFDQKLIGDSDCVIAECSNPSLGVGFMISQGVNMQKPILCMSKRETKLSAMINGCKHIQKCTYDTQSEFIDNVVSFLHKNNFSLKTRKVFMCGPPGSGKSSVSRMLADKHNLINISSGDVVREIIKRNDPTCELTHEIKKYVDNGLLIPSDLMANIIIPVLSSTKATIQGYILDGYPPSFEDMENLRKHNIYPDIVFYFECLTTTAVARQCKRKARLTDNEEIATERVNIFRKNIPSCDYIRENWFPNSLVVIVDAEKELDEVYEYIDSVYSGLTDESSNTAFFPIPLQDMSKLKTTKFHIHVDAADSSDIMNFIKLFYALHPKYQGQLKVYPIRNLNLGSQSKTMSVYDNMMNFHKIDDSHDESFITGRMGDSYDSDFMNAILSTVKLFEGKKFMAEMEEYVYEIEYSDDKIIAENIIPQVEFLKSKEHDNILLNEVPKLELHHGFDLEYNDKLQIDLELLKNTCESHGFDNGGWFVFRNKKNGYRSNEFYNGSLDSAIEKLKVQTVALNSILKSLGYTVKITSNIEIVHGIWST